MYTSEKDLCNSWEYFKKKENIIYSYFYLRSIEAQNAFLLL